MKSQWLTGTGTHALQHWSCCNQDTWPPLRILRLNTPRETAQWLVVAQRSVLVTQDVYCRTMQVEETIEDVSSKFPKGKCLYRHVVYLYMIVSMVCQQIVAWMVFFVILKSRQTRSFLALDASIPVNFAVASHWVLNVYVDICRKLL